MKIPKNFKEILGIYWADGCFKSSYSSVQRLLDFLWIRKTGSVKSVISYCRILVAFILWLQSSKWILKHFPLKARSTSDDLLNWKRKEIERAMQQYLDEVRGRSLKRGLSARYVNTVLACLKTFFRVNGFCREDNRELRLKNYHQPARVRNRRSYVPTIPEVCLMADRAGNIRNRAIILTLYSSGLRNSALRAIQVGDFIKEIDGGKDNLLVKVEPEWNKRIPGACKGSIPYYTFTSVTATQAIAEMLNRRKEEAKENRSEVKLDEPLFVSRGRMLGERMPLSDRELQAIVNNAAKEAGIAEWKHVTPHSLRKVFEGILRSPMIDGDRMDHKDQEWLMGHILSAVQDAYYDYTKINKLREQFAKLAFEDEMTPDQEELIMYKKVASILEIDVNKLKAKRETELGRSLLVSEELALIKKAIKKNASPLRDKKIQKIVPKTELQDYLPKGWKYVGSVDEKSVIIEGTSSDHVEDDSDQDISMQ